jgi:hypothetical protein
MPDTRFHSVREAKEFIAAQVSSQALRDSIPFSETERKMLLFSEVGWAPPDIMEVSDEFDRQYDPNEYEKKISTIIKHLDKRLQKDSPAEYDDWKSAVQYLRPKDHYVNVMIGQAGLRPPHDQLKLFLWALVVIAAFAGGVFISTKYNFGRYFPSQSVMGKLIFAGWLAVIAMGILNLLAPKQTSNVVNKISAKLFARRSGEDE